MPRALLRRPPSPGLDPRLHLDLHLALLPRHRAFWGLVLGGADALRSLRGGESDLHPLAIRQASPFTGHTLAWERCGPEKFLHLVISVRTRGPA